MSGALGRRTPTDWSHVESYPLSALPAAALPTGVPVAIGVNWYTNFDNPVRRGLRWYIGEGPLGSVRGGHCVCLRPNGLSDYKSWWGFYNQGNEGACVGFGSSRMMTLLNRVRYHPWWLWDEAKMVDEWSDTNPGDDNGTTVHAAMRVLLAKGHVQWDTSMPWPGSWSVRDKYVPQRQSGIAAIRWATSGEQIRTVLGWPDTHTHVAILNSWGYGYPHVVHMPIETLDRLINENGEAAIITDR